MGRDLLGAWDGVNVFCMEDRIWRVDFGHNNDPTQMSIT